MVFVVVPDPAGKHLQHGGGIWSGLDPGVVAFEGFDEGLADATVIIPTPSGAVSSETAEAASTQRDHPLQVITEHGRMAWQTASGYTKCARAEAAMGRWKQVIGDRLRAHTDEGRATEVDVAAHALNRMLDLGRPNYIRLA